ncbi:MAG: amino acid aminotransferase [Pseudomonadota bacterium]
MFDTLEAKPEDKIVTIMKLFREDTRADKIDLGVGVYKDATGNTPIMRAVKAAERQLWDKETTKTYTAMIGDGGFHHVMRDLVLGDAVSEDRLAYAHCPGGTGAIHQILQLVKFANPEATVWISDPSWPNHATIIAHLGLNRRDYRYFDAETRAVNFDAMMADLEGAAEGDVIILHGCCHNPTGANLNHAQWDQVAELILAKKLTPFVDIAYQGFGDGVDEDAYGVRLLAAKCPELLIAASCSKNFGIYRERCGIAIVVCDPAQQPIAQSNLFHLNRQNFSFPPDHGARLVTMVMTDDALRADWEKELQEVRDGMISIRATLAASLRDASGSDRFGFLAEHRGMFSRLGATPAQVVTLRETHGIYMIGDSRINIAGITEDKIGRITDAIMAVGV